MAPGHDTTKHGFNAMNENRAAGHHVNVLTDGHYTRLWNSPAKELERVLAAHHRSEWKVGTRAKLLSARRAQSAGPRWRGSTGIDGTWTGAYTWVLSVSHQRLHGFIPEEVMWCCRVWSPLPVRHGMRVQGIAEVGAARLQNIPAALPHITVLPAFLFASEVCLTMVVPRASVLPRTAVLKVQYRGLGAGRACSSFVWGVC